MMLGLSLAAFTLLHVVISLIGIASGLVAVIALVQNRYLRGWTTLFLTTTVLTSVTGFLFPVQKILPSHIVGVISLVVLIVAILALRTFRLAGAWRSVYIVTATLALYLNVFVLLVQAFLKVGFLNALAPTQNEPPFAAAQGLALVIFAVIGFLGVRRFRRAAAL